jgi:hypothetical protein
MWVIRNIVMMNVGGILDWLTRQGGGGLMGISGRESERGGEEKVASKKRFVQLIVISCKINSVLNI